MQQAVIDNIVQLYMEAATAQGIRSGFSHGVTWVANIAGYWPSVVVGTVDSQNIDIVCAKIEENKLPPFWLTVNEPSQSKMLIEKGFREVSRWEGMWLDQSHFRPATSKSTELLIRKVETNEESDEWIGVSMPVLMPGKSINRLIPEYWCQSNKYTLLTAYSNNKAVATALSFTHQQVAGLYFITTLPEHQKKGYASMIVSKLIDDTFKEGVGSIILHASMAGLKLYQNLGFKSTGQLSTYWKVGKF